MGIVEYNEGYKDAWDTYVNAHPKALLFHTLQWKAVMQNTFRNYEFHYLLAEDSGKIIGVFPLIRIRSVLTGNRMVSLPFVPYAGPLYDSEGVLTEFMKYAKKLVKDKNDQLLCVRLKEKTKISGFKISDYFLTFIIDLPAAEEEMLKKMNKVRRKGIKKAEREGITTRMGKDLKDMKIFYDIYVETEKKLGSPAFPWEHFKAIFEAMYPNNMALYIGEYRKKPIVAIMVCMFKDQITIMHGMSRNVPELLSKHPMEFTYWQIFKWAIANKYKTWDFGRSSPKSTGVIDFKSRWGSNRYNTYYYYFLNKTKKLPNYDPDSKKYQLATKLWSKLPHSMNERFGKYLLQHLE